MNAKHEQSADKNGTCGCSAGHRQSDADFVSQRAGSRQGGLASRSVAYKVPAAC